MQCNQWRIHATGGHAPQRCQIFFTPIMIQILIISGSQKLQLNGTLITKKSFTSGTQVLYSNITPSHQIIINESAIKRISLSRFLFKLHITIHFQVIFQTILGRPAQRTPSPDPSPLFRRASMPSDRAAHRKYLDASRPRPSTFDWGPWPPQNKFLFRP